MRVDELLDVSLLEEMITGGFVRVQTDDDNQLRIYNYTEKCQFDWIWNDVTMKCRGLIVNFDGEVVARPWPKFFNFEDYQQGGDAARVTGKVEITDKLDGSLGIMYKTRTGEYALATRGSFTSEQALRGTDMLQATAPPRPDCPQHGHLIWPNPGLTYLFEIVYPENRIVVDYGGESKLVLLGAVETDTGRIYSPQYLSEWPGERAHVFEGDTIIDALAIPPRKNAEGIVVRWVAENDLKMVKIKQEDYIALHRIVTGLNERTVWEELGKGKSCRDICEPLPDEFVPWVEKVGWSLLERQFEIYDRACQTYDFLRVRLNNEGAWDRKDFALQAQNPVYADIRAYLFMLLDKREEGKIKEAIWKTLRPVGVNQLRAITEDVS